MTVEQLEKDIEDMKKALDFQLLLVKLWLDAWKERLYEEQQKMTGSGQTVECMNLEDRKLVLDEFASAVLSIADTVISDKKRLKEIEQQIKETADRLGDAKY